jgi:glycosyltransferase involved in cell wall biosynthesis
MKILLLNYEFPPVGGGAGMATYHLAEALARLDHDVDVLTSGSFTDKPVDKLAGFTVHRALSLRKGIHDCGLRGAATYVGFAMPKLSRLIRNYRYDVYHYFFSLPTGFLTLLPGGWQSEPYIVSLRGSDVPGYDPFNFKLALLHNLLKPITKKIWRRARAVVAVTNSLKRAALEIVPDQQIDVIPNGVDADLFKPLQADPVDRPSFRLICVSRLIERKGIEDILSALAELPSEDIKLSVVGSGHHENRLKQRCNELALNSVVDFKGFCPRENLPSLYAQSDAFILTSRSEAFGNVFAEAMSCGMPIIGTTVGGIPDLVSEENGILVEPGNIAGIKNAILRLKASRTLCRNMGLANREKIESDFRWPKIAEKFLRLYSNQY